MWRRFLINDAATFSILRKQDSKTGMRRKSEISNVQIKRLYYKSYDNRPNNSLGGISRGMLSCSHIYIATYLRVIKRIICDRRR
jgi:hypothetical protein